MTDIVYTREVAITDSELVDEVYYNENTRDLYVDLNDQVYRYADVPVSKVEEFAVAPSPGSYYNNCIKGKFISANLGHWLNLDYEEVDVVEKTAVAGYAAPGFRVSGDGVAHIEGTLVANTTPAVPLGEAANPVPKPHFSLSPFKDNGVAKVEGVEREYVVTFEVDGLGGTKRHTLKSTSVDKAVDAVLELGAMLELNFVVREVLIRFE